MLFLIYVQIACLKGCTMNSDSYKIKSFKHNGHLHRMWLDNWLVPVRRLLPEHRKQSLNVMINNQTVVIEAGGRQWMSRTPAVTYFIPNEWYNIVGLIEDAGIRYYCNIASPPHISDKTLTYIDYDLDVIVSAAKEIAIVDEGE